jgi:uroporphyrinogen decarboxylase
MATISSNRNLIKTLAARREGASRCGFWLGNPHADTWPILHAHFGTQTEEELRLKLEDDFRWISPQFFDSVYPCPEGAGFFGTPKIKAAHGQAGPFAHTEDPREVEEYDWPDPERLNFDTCLSALEAAGPFFRASGFWSPFFHDIMDLFGMEDYMVKMFTHPDVVLAVTDRVCGFYFQANERFFEAAGDLIDGYFFGNDFGTQRDLIVSPSYFDRFILPWLRKFTAQAHSHGYPALLHSCGSIYRVIERLIEAGVDVLHPLQARAAGMEAESLARNFGQRITFFGGVDTQHLLINATPAEVKAEVRRLKDIFGPHYIVSPSHEALLPNIPPQNIAAMAEAALE